MYYREVELHHLREKAITVTQESHLREQEAKLRDEYEALKQLIMREHVLSSMSDTFAEAEFLLKDSAFRHELLILEGQFVAASLAQSQSVFDKVLPLAETFTQSLKQHAEFAAHADFDTLKDATDQGNTDRAKLHEEMEKHITSYTNAPFHEYLYSLRRSIKIYQRHKFYRTVVHSIIRITILVMVFVIIAGFIQDVANLFIANLVSGIVLWFVGEYIIGPIIHKRFQESKYNNLLAVLEHFYQAKRTALYLSTLLHYEFTSSPTSSREKPNES